jgi:hypothetical protein
MSISSQQSRGARGLLNWKLSDLAAASAIGLSTLKHFEHARRRTTPENLAAIRRAFEKAGIIFESDGKFVGVRLRIKHESQSARQMIRASSRNRIEPVLTQTVQHNDMKPVRRVAIKAWDIQA